MTSGRADRLGDWGDGSCQIWCKVCCRNIHYQDPSPQGHEVHQMLQLADAPGVACGKGAQVHLNHVTVRDEPGQDPFPRVSVAEEVVDAKTSRRLVSTQRRIRPRCGFDPGTAFYAPSRFGYLRILVLLRQEGGS
jgi:hypothetical protein